MAPAEHGGGRLEPVVATSREPEGTRSHSEEEAGTSSTLVKFSNQDNSGVDQAVLQCKFRSIFSSSLLLVFSCSPCYSSVLIWNISFLDGGHR